jgi:hypothetical protein
MTDPRRERADELINDLDELARAYDLHDFGLPCTPEEREKHIRAVLAFERAAEARVLREFVAWMEWRRWTGTRAIRTLPEYMNEFMQGREEGRE